MRNLVPTITIIALILIGCASKPPTAFEQRWFNIETNYIPKVEVKTNTVVVTLVQTNVVPVTNTVGVTELKTNLVPILVYQTNTITTTNLEEVYAYSPGATAKVASRQAGEVAGMFNPLIGGMVSTALAGLFSVWSLFRSNKNYRTAANMAQTIEVLRNFIKTLPNGAAYDTAFVQWMQQHQSEEAVLQNVVNLLAKEVSSGEARTAAVDVMNMIEAMRTSTGGAAPLVVNKVGI